MRSALIVPLIGVLLTAAPGCTSRSAVGPGMTNAEPPVVKAPATYAGTFPCASCPGIEQTLTLLEDGTYRLRRVYLEAERGQDRAQVELGRCDGTVDPAPLAGTYWRLTELPGADGFTVDPRLRAHLMLDGEKGRVSGSSGCNRLVGTFTLNDGALRFGPLAGTRMACPPPAMELERRFHAALASVTGYAIDGETLTLRGLSGPVARFVRYLE